MDASRKRTVRLTITLIVAALLASALVYTSFSASTDTQTPSGLIEGEGSSNDVRLAGTITKDSADREGKKLRFKLRDSAGGKSIDVEYIGTVPDPFKDDGTREAIVTGSFRKGVFYAERDSLITKCPSKFKDKQKSKKT